MADTSDKIATAAVHTIEPAGERPPLDLSTVVATDIQIKFRPALPDQVPDAEHAYIEITRANGAHQTIGAYPIGGTVLSHEGGQLTFAAGQEKNQPTAAEFELHVPKGMTRTEYANSLVDGAKAYNAHALRYDGLGEDGVNSNSFVSSLTIAKGGATGLADIRHIASVVDTSPVRTAHAASTMTDEQAANLVEHDLHSGRRVAPGFGNASIEPQRFTRDAAMAAATPPPGIPRHDARAAIPAAILEAGLLVQAAFDELRGLKLHPSTPPYLPGGTMHVRYGGKEQEVGPGYRQSGTITNVQDGIVTQSTGRTTVDYKMSDLTADARDPAAMEKMLVSGRFVQITVGSENVHVASLESNHDLDLAQRHGASHGGR